VCVCDPRFTMVCVCVVSTWTGVPSVAPPAPVGEPELNTVRPQPAVPCGPSPTLSRSRIPNHARMSTHAASLCCCVHTCRPMMLLCPHMPPRLCCCVYTCRTACVVSTHAAPLVLCPHMPPRLCCVHTCRPACVVSVCVCQFAFALDQHSWEELVTAFDLTGRQPMLELPVETMSEPVVAPAPAKGRGRAPAAR
jgi:hypothetical protein